MINRKNDNSPIENHKTAAWSNVETANTIAKTAHPSLAQTKQAKEYVDENEK